MAAGKATFVVLVALSLWLLAALVDAQGGQCPCPSGQCCSKHGYCGTSDDYCGKNNCASQCPAGCFSGDAMIEMFNGERKLMTQLAIGDKVAVTKNGRDIMYEEIYAFGHKDPSTIHPFLRIEMEALAAPMRRNLELTRGHFVPNVLEDKARLEYKRAQDVMVGDIMLAVMNASSRVVLPFVIKEVLVTETSQGLYNPFTMSGTIIVDGVVASAHSEWFLDHNFDLLGLTGWLPAVYQTVLAPARVLYSVLGKEAYAFIYNNLDSRINIASVGTYYGGTIVSATFCGLGCWLSFYSV